jgi:predicted nucleotidyltransferase
MERRPPEGRLHPTTNQTNEPELHRKGDSPGTGTLEHVSELTALIETHRDAITGAARQHKGRTIAVFGSVARGEDTETSDIDFLVEFEPDSSLFDVLHLQEALQDLLGRRVDVVSAGGLTDRDDHIRREAIPR